MAPRSNDNNNNQKKNKNNQKSNSEEEDIDIEMSQNACNVKNDLTQISAIAKKHGLKPIQHLADKMDKV